MFSACSTLSYVKCVQCTLWKCVLLVWQMCVTCCANVCYFMCKMSVTLCSKCISQCSPVISVCPPIKQSAVRPDSIAVSTFSICSYFGRVMFWLINVELCFGSQCFG